MFHSSFHLGVLGGGQLGRMLIPPALRLGICLHFLGKRGSTCQECSPNFREGQLTQMEDVLSFAKNCNAITIEIENVSIEALTQLEREGLPVQPAARIVALSQNKLKQKDFFRNNGFPTANYRAIHSQAELMSSEIKFPVVQKLQQTGYDGRGVLIFNNSSDLKGAFTAPSILEDKITFEKELAVIVARDSKNNLVVYPPVEMRFHNSQNILEYLFCPAQVEDEIHKKSQEMACDLANSLQIVGLLAVEMFFTKEGQLLINEIAPRPHNSGHYSIDSCLVCQFEQHLRAVCGFPLAKPAFRGYAATVNILGNSQESDNLRYENLENILKMPDVALHLYGKKEVRPFRKMGHVSIVGQDYHETKRKLQLVQEALR